MSRVEFKQPTHKGRREPPYPLLPLAKIATLSESEIHNEYDAAFGRFQQGRLIRALEKPEFTTNQLQALYDLQKRAVAAYIAKALPRLRTAQEPERISLQERPGFTRDDLSRSLAASNGGYPLDFHNLMVRVCDVQQVGQALATGTDRTAITEVKNPFDREAMEDYGVSNRPDLVTYVKDFFETTRPIAVDRSQALLVYGPEALQSIMQRSDIGTGSPDLMMFIDERLVLPGLLAIIQN